MIIIANPTCRCCWQHEQCQLVTWDEDSIELIKEQVYTAPHAPATTHDTPAPAPVSATPATTESVASASTADVAPTTTSHHDTAPSNLLASSAPGAASIPFLGAVAGGSEHHTSTQPERRVFDTPLDEPSSNTFASEPVPVQTISNATHADVPATTTVTGESSAHTATAATTGTTSANGTTTTTAEEPHGLAATAQGYAAGVLGSLGAVFGTAAVAVEKATGIDLIHGNPVSRVVR